MHHLDYGLSSEMPRIEWHPEGRFNGRSIAADAALRRRTRRAGGSTNNLSVEVNSHVAVVVTPASALRKNIRYLGFVRIIGSIALARSPQAAIDTQQINKGNRVTSADQNRARVTDDVARSAEGNIQLNLASGNLNAQNNAIALSTADGQRAGANATVHDAQLMPADRRLEHIRIRASQPRSAPGYPDMAAGGLGTVPRYT